MNRFAFSGGGLRMPCCAASSTSCFATSMRPSWPWVAELGAAGDEPAEGASCVAEVLVDALEDAAAGATELGRTGAGRSSTFGFFVRGPAGGRASEDTAVFSVGGIEVEYSRPKYAERGLNRYCGPCR